MIAGWAHPAAGYAAALVAVALLSGSVKAREYEDAVCELRWMFNRSATRGTRVRAFFAEGATTDEVVEFFAAPVITCDVATASDVTRRLARQHRTRSGGGG